MSNHKRTSRDPMSREFTVAKFITRPPYYLDRVEFDDPSDRASFNDGLSEISPTQGIVSFAFKFTIANRSITNIPDCPEDATFATLPESILVALPRSAELLAANAVLLAVTSQDEDSNQSFLEDPRYSYAIYPARGKKKSGQKSSNVPGGLRVTPISEHHVLPRNKRFYVPLVRQR